MRRLALTITALLLATPAFAVDRDWREDYRDRQEDRRDRYEDRLDHREDIHDRREDYRDRREDYRDRRDNAHYGHPRHNGYDRWDYRRNYADIRYDRYWTPYGFGRDDPFARRWAYRHSDHNRNGKLGDREWRDARIGFYRFADRNRDGYIERREYAWALDRLRGGHYRGGW